MIRGQRCSRFFQAVVLAAVVALVPGCTLLDEVLPGTPFTPDQPVAEVTVVGGINIDRATGDQEGCAAGRALLWGTVRNTGDIDLVDVFIEVDALDGSGRVLDTYRVNVFNGDLTEVEGATPEEEPIQLAGTSLAVGESGTFEVCTGLAYGSVVSTAYRADFIQINVIE